jgi:hypothetical protein
VVSGDITPQPQELPLKRLSTVSSRGVRGDHLEILSPLSNISPIGNIDTHKTLHMYVDMTLAASYRPVLVCIMKVCILMVFHYTSVPLLFATERYALMLAALYIDKLLCYEYIVNTNSCSAILAVSLLVHELRDTGVQERIHGELAHTIVLSLLVVTNILVLTLGEQSSLLNWICSFCVTTSSSAPIITAHIAPDHQFKQHRAHIHLSAYNQSPPTTGALICLVFTCALLVVLSTCAMPVSAHDPVLTNLRVWSFTVLSMTWMYTVNYRSLRYSCVAPFSPCLLRFSSVLFLTPTPFAVCGVALMAVCLATTHKFIQKQHHEKWSGCSAELDVYTSPPHIDEVSVVLREKPQGGIISYRTPVVIPEKIVALGKSLNCGREVTRGVSSSIIQSGYDVPQIRTGSLDVASVCDIGIQDPISLKPEIPDIDYNTLFEQVMCENAV